MGPLKGLKIIEMAGIGPGPFCGMVLADLGAEIIKIENGASRRQYYRLKKNEQKAILMDSSKEPKQFENFLKVHKILSKTKISIPKIYEIDRNKKNILLELVQ